MAATKYPFGDRPFVLQCVGNTKFVQVYDKLHDLIADADGISEKCYFQIVQLGTGEHKLLSRTTKTFVSAISGGPFNPTLQLFAYTNADEWSRFNMFYDAGLGQFTFRTSMPKSNAAAPWVHAYGPERRLVVGQYSPDDVWCRFIPYPIQEN